EVDRDLHTDQPPEKMLERTRAEPVQDSGQLRIDYEDSDPQRAEQISLQIADVYTRQHNADEQGKLREERVILSTLDRPNQAVLTWPITRVVVPVAALLGFLTAVAVVLALAYLDDSIRSADDIGRFLQLPLLGIVPRYQRPVQRPTSAAASREEKPVSQPEVSVSP
ncbi:MAG TPA: hypothetical protein VFG86_25335, partial [Chloroflexota bacterium]|nr:hypothetical protein [Chloroflexota bacterium]